MKIAKIIVRTLLGAMFLFGSIPYFLHLYPQQPPLTGNMKIFMDGVNASGYLMNLVKGTELVCGLALVVGRFVPLALVILCPIIINILFVNAILTPSGWPIGAVLLLADLFVAYCYRDNYKGLLAAK
jgi:putative oxidoreductase